MMESQASQPYPKVEKQWHAAFPIPKSTPDAMTRSQLLELLAGGDKKPGRDFLIVDLRRTDHEGGTIRGSLNLPAQSLWYSLDTLYELCNAAAVPLVVFYCGSSRGRGSRAAAWFQDLLADRGNTTIKSMILAEGIDGWFGAGGTYTTWIDG